MSLPTILGQYNRITDEGKKDLFNKTEKLQEYWEKERSESVGRPIRTTPAACYFNWDLGCKHIYTTREIAKGETELKLIECVSQNGPAFFEALARAFGTESDASDTAAVHVEFGIGFAAGLYFSGSGGVGFDVPELKTAKITSTTCWGVKFDVSFGGGISVSFLPKMSDLLGTAVTIELGMDVPGTEIG